MERTSNITLLLGATLFAGPLMLDLASRDGFRKAFSLLAADTFYYLEVSQNLVASGVPSFDGERATNGFHPLWQLATAAITGVVRLAGGGKEGVIWSVIGLGFICVLAGLCWIGKASIAAHGHLSAAYLLLPVGVLTVVENSVLRLGWGGHARLAPSLWASVNGMESGVVVASFGAAALACVAAPRTWRGFALIGMTLCALSASRLDHAIFALVTAAAIALCERRAGRRALLPLALVSLGLAGYVAVNRAYSGMSLPVSGALKSTFPSVTTINAALMVQMVTHPSKLAATHAQRAFQMVLPALAAVIYGMRCRRSSGPPWPGDGAVENLDARGRMRIFMAANAVGVIVLAAYNFLFVPKLNQGFWYFPVSNLFASLVLIEPFAQGLHEADWSARVAIGVRAACAVLVLATYLVFRPTRGNGEACDFFLEGSSEVKAFYGAHPPKILEFDDGVVTFSTGFSGMSGMGLALDAGAIEAAGGFGLHRTGQNLLLSLALARGFDRFTSLGYVRAPLNGRSSDDDIRKAYEDFVDDQARPCRMGVEYRASKSRFSIIRVTCPRSFLRELRKEFPG